MFFKSTSGTVKYLISTLDTDPPFKGPNIGQPCHDPSCLAIIGKIQFCWVGYRWACIILTLPYKRSTYIGYINPLQMIHSNQSFFGNKLSFSSQHTESFKTCVFTHLLPINIVIVMQHAVLFVVALRDCFITWLPWCRQHQAGAKSFKSADVPYLRENVVASRV